MKGTIRTYGFDYKIDGVESIQIENNGEFEAESIVFYGDTGNGYEVSLEDFTGFKFDKLCEVTVTKNSDRFNPIFIDADSILLHRTYLEFYKNGKIEYRVQKDDLKEIALEEAEMKRYVVTSNDDDFNYIDEEYRTFNTKEEAEEQIKEWEFVDEKEGFEGIHYNIKEVLA